jgi:hypothetical protein
VVGLLIWCWRIGNDTDRVQLEKTNHLTESFIAGGRAEGAAAGSSSIPSMAVMGMRMLRLPNIEKHEPCGPGDDDLPVGKPFMPAQGRLAQMLNSP